MKKKMYFCSFKKMRSDFRVGAKCTLVSVGDIGS